MSIIRDLKRLEYSTFSEHRRAIYWVQPFVIASNALKNIVGERYGGNVRPQHDYFGDDGIRRGFYSTKSQTCNIKELLMRMNPWPGTWPMIFYMRNILPTSLAESEMKLKMFSTRQEWLTWTEMIGHLWFCFSSPCFQNELETFLKWKQRDGWKETFHEGWKWQPSYRWWNNGFHHFRWPRREEKQRKCDAKKLQQRKRCNK